MLNAPAQTHTHTYTHVYIVPTMTLAPDDVFLPPEVISVGQTRRKLPLTDARNACLPEGNFLDCTVSTMAGEFNLTSWQKTIVSRPQFGMEKQVHTREWSRRSIASTDSMSAFSDDHSATSNSKKTTLSKAARVLGLLQGRGDGHRATWRQSTDELRSMDHVLLGSQQTTLPPTSEDIPPTAVDVATSVSAPDSPTIEPTTPTSARTTFVSVASGPSTRTPSISEKSIVTPVVEIAVPVVSPVVAPVVEHSSPLRTKAEEKARREQQKLDKLKDAVRARNAKIEAADRAAREKKAAKLAARKEAKSASLSRSTPAPTTTPSTTPSNPLRWSSQLTARAAMKV